MNKKIVYILVCLISIFSFNNVKAENTCTSEDISNARVTLSLSNIGAFPIPALGRTQSTGKANIYEMTLTNRATGSTVNSFCLDSGKQAYKNLTYKISYEVLSPGYKKIYQYGMEYKNDSKNGSLKFIVAQAALWATKEGKSNLIKSAARDIYIGVNCNTIMQGNGMSSREASDFCSTAMNNDNSTSMVLNKIVSSCEKRGGSNCYNVPEQIFKKIDEAYNHFSSYSSQYPGKLYYWVATDGSNYQAMLAPLDCGGNDDDGDNPPGGKRYSCTDSNGVKHDYTDEYKACILSGKNSSVCKAEYNNKYCSSSTKKYIVKNTGNSAVCTNNSTNVGSYNEYVVESSEGNAIPGKGDSEKVINSYCNLYCLENVAQQVFPGNVKPAVSVGTYIIWPTSESTLSSKYKNKYPLSFTGQKTCYVVMSGTNNPVNSTNINEVYKALISNIKNENGKYVNKTYDATRLSGGCEQVYTPVCNNYKNTSDTAYRTWQNYINSSQYKNAISSKASKDEANAKVAACQNSNNNKNNAKESALNVCSNNRSTCMSAAKRITSRRQKLQKIEECNTSFNSCSDGVTNNDAYKNESCGSYQDTSGETRIINQASTYEKEYEEANAPYKACITEKNACNSYTTAINNLIDFAKEIKACTTYTPNCSGTSCDIYNYATNVDLSWGDPEYGATITDSELEKTINYSSSISQSVYSNVTISSNQSFNTIKDNTSSLINSVSNVTNNRKITANVNVTYSLPTKELLYNYVVKRSDSYKSQTAKPSSDSNFNTIGFSNLPISYDASTNSTYELRLSNVRFGDNGGQYSPADYVCNYNVTKTQSTDCLCHSGTYAGKDLSNIAIDQNLTCSAAQEKYCNENPTPNSCPNGEKTSEMTSCLQKYDYFTCYDLNCRDNSKDKFCPDNPSINLSACLNNYDYNYCYNLLCTGGNNDGNDPSNPPGNDGYKCKNSNGVDGEMDITACVYTKMAQGLSRNEAINACDALVCPLSGLRIIYRTISLENPFPSKTADASVTQKGLSVGMFNDSILGRYPGTNWNDTNLVKNHILYVTRQGNKIDGSNIYKSEPLYKFVLDTKTINAIRNYNKTRQPNGGYADFTLECRLNNSRACVSEKFVHNTELSGLVSGVCMNSTSKTNFYSCSGDK